MNLGNKLLELRKAKHLSQEEVAEKLNVSRQTISKWETDQSTPDFDKIAPLCELYGITPNELLTNEKHEEENIESEKTTTIEEPNRRNKIAKGISLGILLYFISIVWIMIAIPVLMINPIIASAIFLLICGFATFTIVYVCIMYKKKDRKDNKSPEEKLRDQILEIIAIFFTIIYLIISFSTMAWHITWLIWIVFAIIESIIKLIFILRGMKNEK